MDKSSKTVDAALKTLREVKAALAAAGRFTDEFDKLFVAALPEAERAYYAALRADKIPRVDCADCQRRFEPGEQMIWQCR